MSKIGERFLENTFPRSTDDADGENAPLWTLSLEGQSEGVRDFVSAHGLTHKRDLFEKAALLYTRGESSGLTATEPGTFNPESEHKWRQPKALYFTIFVCSLGAIAQGWAQTGICDASSAIRTGR